MKIDELIHERMRWKFFGIPLQTLMERLMPIENMLTGRVQHPTKAVGQTVKV